MIEVEIEDEAWIQAVPQAVAIAEEAARAALAARPDADVVVLLTDDATLRDLNARFRGKDATTNVLSFPAAASAGAHLGDVALAYGVCASEALDAGKTVANHLRHLVIHGVLHLLGYDHMTDVEAEAMEGLERDILAGLGAPDPYSSTDAPD